MTRITAIKLMCEQYGISASEAQHYFSITPELKIENMKPSELLAYWELMEGNRV